MRKNRENVAVSGSPWQPFLIFFCALEFHKVLASGWLRKQACKRRYRGDCQMPADLSAPVSQPFRVAPFVRLNRFSAQMRPDAPKCARKKFSSSPVLPVADAQPNTDHEPAQFLAGWNESADGPLLLVSRFPCLLVLGCRLPRLASRALDSHCCVAVGLRIEQNRGRTMDFPRKLRGRGPLTPGRERSRLWRLV
jgi:hypothetical protein